MNVEAVTTRATPAWERWPVHPHRRPAIADAPPTPTPATRSADGPQSPVSAARPTSAPAAGSGPSEQQPAAPAVNFHRGPNAGVTRPHLTAHPLTGIGRFRLSGLGDSQAQPAVDPATPDATLVPVSVSSPSRTPHPVATAASAFMVTPASPAHDADASAPVSGPTQLPPILTPQTSPPGGAPAPVEGLTTGPAPATQHAHEARHHRHRLQLGVDEAASSPPDREDKIPTGHGPTRRLDASHAGRTTGTPSTAKGPHG